MLIRRTKGEREAYMDGYEAGYNKGYNRGREFVNGDVISRDYIIQQIQKAKESNYNFNYNTLIDFIKVLPSAEKKQESEEEE